MDPNTLTAQPLSTGQSIELFTLVALMVSIFGATYTSTSAIKNWLNDRLRKKLEDSKEQTDFIITNSPPQEHQAYVNVVKKYYGKTKRWSTVWYHSFAVPTILFTAWSFFIGIYVYFCSNPHTPYNWEKWKLIIPIFVAIDALSIIAAILAYLFVIRASNHLSEFFGTRQQEVASIEGLRSQQEPAKKNGPNATPKQ